MPATSRAISPSPVQEPLLNLPPTEAEPAALVDLLKSVAIASNQASTFEEAARIALRQVAALKSWDLGHVYQIADDQHAEPTGFWLCSDTQRFMPFLQATSRTRLAPDQGLPGRVVAHRGPVWIADLATDAGAPRAALALELGLKVGFGFPVLVGEEVVAVLEFYSARGERPEARFLEAMAQVGTQLGRVVERRRAHDALERANRENQLLLQVALAANHAEHFDEALLTTLEAVCGAIGWPIGHAYVRSRDEPDVLVSAGLWHVAEEGAFVALRERTAATPLRLGEGLPGMVLASRQPEWIPDVSLHPNFPINKQGDPGVRAGFAFPVMVGEDIAAVLEFFHRDVVQPDPVVLRTATTVGTQVGRVAEREQAARALAAKVQELARSNAELEQFAYVASHDLQEPLRMVASYVQLLQRRYQGKLDPDADEFIRFAAEGATRMQGLINALLTYSRAGRANPLAPVDLDGVLERAVYNLQDTLGASEATITYDAMPTVVADESLMLQVLQNLLSNAMKFRGPDAPRIHVGAVREDGAWRLWVHDNGIGIAPEFHQRIFVIFQRLHPREQYEGTGIGLALCKKIVEQRGGRIWLDSAPGQGTTFHFTIPDLGADSHAR